jgi:hypothetical protein
MCQLIHSVLLGVKPYDAVSVAGTGTLAGTGGARHQTEAAVCPDTAQAA